MSGPICYRASPAELEVRDDGRTVVGLAVPFGVEADIVDAEGAYRESFRRGAFDRTIRERGLRVKALAQHDRRGLPLGRAHTLTETDDGLHVELHVSKTRAGDEALELVRDGALDGLSIGFRPIESRWSNDRQSVERLEVRLDEISLVAFPAYDEARVLAVRFGVDGMEVWSPATSDSADSVGRSETVGIPDGGLIARRMNMKAAAAAFTHSTTRGVNK